MALFLAAVGVLLYVFHYVPWWVMFVFALPLAFAITLMTLAFVLTFLSAWFNR